MLAHFALLILLLQQAAADSLYDPYGLNKAETEQQPLAQPESESRAAQAAAYRTYYLILVRRLHRIVSRQFESLDPPDDAKVPLGLGSGWMLDGASLRGLKAAAELDEPGVEQLQDANDLLLALFGNLQPASEAGSSHQWWRLFDSDWLVLAIVAFCGVAAFCWIVLRRVSAWQLFAAMFISSWVVNYIRLYRLELAQRQHAVTSLHCRPAGQTLSIFESISLWFTGTMRVAPPKNDCLKQLEALAVDPFWDVNPLEAAIDLLGNIVLNRLVQLMQAVNLGYRHLIEGLPIWHSVGITFILLFLPTLFLLLRSGYGLRLMYGLLHVGPDANRLHAERLDTLERENRRLLELVHAAPQPTPARALQRSASIAVSQRQRPDDRGDGPAAAPAVLARTPPLRMRASRSECNISVAASVGDDQ